MSEGQRFLSVVPNLTLRLPGIKPVEFKDGKFPDRDKECFDQQVIGQIKASPEYGKVFISVEDKIERDKPTPAQIKSKEDMVEKAIAQVANMPGMVAAVVKPPAPQAVVGTVGSRTLESPVVEEEPEPEPEPEPEAKPLVLPTLTAVTRMKKDDLLDLAEKFHVDVPEGDTVAILKRKVKSWIKQNA